MIMKKFFTLLTGLLFSLSLFAFNGNRMNISIAASNMNFKVEVDGQNVFIPGNSITLNNLSEGNHNVRVYRVMNYYQGKRIVSRFSEIIYATTVFLGSDYQVDIMINGFGKVFMDAYRVEPDNDFSGDYSSSFGYNGSDYNSNTEYSNIQYNNIMSEREFYQVKEQIKKEWADATRLISVKTIIAKNNFTTKQIKDLMTLFVFDDNRLEVVKLAYCNIIDKQNIYQLMDELTFSSSKDELARFIRESK